MNKWHERYLSLAKVVSTWSKDPRKKVGAVVTENNYIVGQGFNGFPSLIEDTEQRLKDKELKNKLMIHAEINAILASSGQGDTIYVYPCLPCTACLMVILQVGITDIVTSREFKNKPSQWDKTLVCLIAEECGVDISYV